MAKPDWGELQQRFLSDHAATVTNGAKLIHPSG